MMHDIDGRTAAGNRAQRFTGWIAAVTAGGALAAAMLHAEAVADETYPTRAIRLIVPAPPGGASDIVGRLVASKLGEALKRQIVVDNRSGGGQVIATELGARAVPDGYTLLMVSAAHGINPGLLKKLPYDSIRDFAPISLIADSPLIFAAHPSLGVGDIRELIALAKSRPGRINYGSSTPGTGGHLSVELLKWMTGIDLVHIPYKGAAQALTEVIGGHVQLICSSPLSVLPHVRSGKLRGLAMTGRSRSRVAPELPTVAESGVPGFQSSLWYVLLAPAATPQAIVRRLHSEAAALVRLPDVVEQLVAQGADPIGSTPQEAHDFMRAEIDRWTKLIQQADIRAD
jgi:tripartite-type tricarboxylate transporter receptor subunit TctC